MYLFSFLQRINNGKERLNCGEKRKTQWKKSQVRRGPEKNG